MEEKYPELRRLRIPTNWCVHRTAFYDISPDQINKFKVNPEDDGWTLFNQYLLHIEYGVERRWTLSLSWVDPFDPKGRFILSISDEDWMYKSPTYDEMTSEEVLQKIDESVKLETRSLKEITDAVNQKMLEISLKAGDYSFPSPQRLQLQEFVPADYVHYVKNEFFDIEPSQDLSAEQWQLFQGEMLIVEHYKDSDWQMTAGWFPAFDPNGQYRIKVSLEKIDREMFEVFETRDKNEAVAYIDDVFSVHLKKLYERYNKKVKADKERARQLKLQIQRNQKI